MTLTDRQRRAVDAAGHVAITAGAGTGKTHTLGHRYLHHLEEGLSPLRVVAVTFTERAAHELRARVRAYAQGRFAAGDARLAELEAAPIGTVHALCLRICREHPDAAGLPPHVRILDPLEGEVWWAERLERALASAPPELFASLPYERARDALAELLRDPYRGERALEVGREGWAEQVERARAEADRVHLGSDEVAEAAAVLSTLAARPDGDAGERTRQRALAAFRAARAGDAEAAADAASGARANVGAKGAWGDDRDRLRSALAVVLPAVRAWLDDPRSRLELGPADTALEELLPALRAGFARARDALAAAKRRAGVVDFSDVEVAALRALGDPVVIDHYRARWSALLVDEVQDTSPVQEAILTALAGFCRTTVVGDAKQSVYGFRGADPAVFHRMTERVQRAGGEAVVLDRSFRTHGRLVEGANRAFEALLGGDHEPLTAHDPDPPTDDPPLRHWAVDAARGVPSGARRRAEARRIAEEIRARLEAGTPVRDPDAPGGRRPLRAGDVAVLARSWAPLDLLAELLPAYGVPAVHTGGGDLLGTREAQDAICALRAVVDEDDDVALVALLRGPMFAVSDVDLERFAGRSIRPDGAGSKPARWWPALRSERPAWAERFVAVLEEVREAAAHEPPSRLLQLLDRATGWSAVVANLPGGSRRLTDLEGVVDLVRELERGSGDVFGVVRRLRRLQRAGAKVERPALEAGDAVTLTTIHRSKGLEWPWVVVAALDAGTRGRPPALRMDPELGVAVRVEAGDERRAAPALWTLLEMQDVAAEEAEDRRLLYVALTRAADAATVSAAGGSGRYLDLLAPGLERAGVMVEARPFDPDDARWPSPPRPDGRGGTEPARDRLDAGVVGRAEAERDRDSSVDRSGPGGRPHAQAKDASAWDLAQAWVEAIAPEVGGLVADLRADGVPAPRTEPASESGGASVLLRWETDAGPVHLLEPGTEDDGGGAASPRGLAVDPDDPEAARRRLLRALRGDAG